MCFVKPVRGLDGSSLYIILRGVLEIPSKSYPISDSETGSVI